MLAHTLVPWQSTSRTDAGSSPSRRIARPVLYLVLLGIAVLSPGASATAQETCFEGTRAYRTGDSSWAAALADLDLDGDTDLAVANRSDSDVTVFLNDGDGRSLSPTSYTVGATPQALTIA